MRPASYLFRELFGGGGGGSLEEECADDAVSKIFEDEPVLVDLDSSNIHMAKWCKILAPLDAISLGSINVLSKLILLRAEACGNILKFLKKYMINLTHSHLAFF